MRFVCIFLPALCALGIQLKRGSDELNGIGILIRYGIWVLFINLISMVSILFFLRTDGILEDAMTSFSFASKYIVISLILSLILPYIIEVFSKYVRISFEVNSNKNTEDEKKD